MLPFTDTARPLGTNSEPDIIWVGSRESCYKHGGAFLDESQVCVVSFEDMTASLIDRVRPAHIYSCLFASDFDGTELAIRLQSSGFHGHYTAIAEDVPDPEVILRDVRMAAPTLHFDLIVTTAIPARLN
ncbi:MAG: hypothetical protein AAF092_10650 [Pseudomonadota bacterium]